MASLLKEFHRWCEAAQENMSAHWGSSLINDVLLSVSLAATATKTANQMLLERTRNPSHLPETNHAVKVLFDIETSLHPFLTAHRKLLELAWDDSPEDLNLRKRLMPNLSNFTKTS